MGSRGGPPLGECSPSDPGPGERRGTTASPEHPGTLAWPTASPPATGHLGEPRSPCRKQDRHPSLRIGAGRLYGHMLSRDPLGCSTSRLRPAHLRQGKERQRYERRLRPRPKRRPGRAPQRRPSGIGRYALRVGMLDVGVPVRATPRPPVQRGGGVGGFFRVHVVRSGGWCVNWVRGRRVRGGRGPVVRGRLRGAVRSGASASRLASSTIGPRRRTWRLKRWSGP